MKENPDKWFTVKEIGEKIGISTGSCRVCLRKLIKSSDIVFMKISGKNSEKAPFLYRYKIDDMWIILYPDREFTNIKRSGGYLEHVVL